MKKANTLLEVLIALTIFALMFALTLSIYSSVSTLSYRQNEYTYFETICLDIDKYYDEYYKEFDTYYFEEHNEEGSSIYYNATFTTCAINDATYKLTYSYEDDKLVVSIVNINANRPVIDNLEYGVSKNYEN